MWSCKECKSKEIRGEIIGKFIGFGTPDKTGKVQNVDDDFEILKSSTIGFTCCGCGNEGRNIEDIADWRE